LEKDCQRRELLMTTAAQRAANIAPRSQLVNGLCYHKIYHEGFKFYVYEPVRGVVLRGTGVKSQERNVDIGYIAASCCRLQHL